MDYKADIDTQAWALLEADSTFTSVFKPNCRLKDGPTDAMQAGIQVAPNDFPRIRIYVGGDDPISRNPPKTFAMTQTSYSYSDVDVPVPCMAKLTCEMTFAAEMQKADRFAAEALVRKIWMQAHPKFGLIYVNDFSISSTRKTVMVPPSILVTQTLTFNLRPMLSQLVA